MRVIAGKYKGRRLGAPEGTDTRPTSDRLRETLFNVVAPEIEGSTWLDLFAGTGAVGIEALSRGAARAVFVEPAVRPLRTIKKNIALVGAEQDAEIVDRDAIVALRMLESSTASFDFCFLDPPYRKMGDYEQVLKFLSTARLLNPGGTVIAEHDKHFDPGPNFGPLGRRRTLKQGDAVLSFYKRDIRQDLQQG
jgi:16S rRNA (guanine(966)-N(2))-methyltransferase RsmD